MFLKIKQNFSSDRKITIHKIAPISNLIEPNLLVQKWNLKSVKSIRQETINVQKRNDGNKSDRVTLIGKFEHKIKSH